MKKLLISTIVLSTIFSGVASAKVVSEDFNITINDKSYTTPEGEQKPYINEDGRTMVPVRFISTQLGVPDTNIQWDENTQTATISAYQQIKVTIGQRSIMVGGKVVPMDTAAELTDNRVFIPAGFIANALNWQSVWNDKTRTVNFSPKVGIVTDSPTKDALKQNTDGSSSLNNIQMSSSLTNSQTADQLQSNTDLFSKAKFTFNGDSVIVSVPATGQDNIHWVIGGLNGQWEGTEAKTMTISNSPFIVISLYDRSTGHGLMEATLIYKDGNWSVVYPNK